MKQNNVCPNVKDKCGQWREQLFLVACINIQSLCTATIGEALQMQGLYGIEKSYKTSCIIIELLQKTSFDDYSGFEMLCYI